MSISPSSNRVPTGRAAESFRRYLPILISAGLGVALSATLFFAVGGWERTRLKALFDQQAEIRATRIRQRLFTSFEALSGAGALYAVSPHADEPAFRVLANRIVSQHPEIQSIELHGNESGVTMKRAREAGELVTTGRLRLKSSSDQFGVQIIVPLHRDHLQGFITAILRVRKMVELSLVGLKPALIDLGLYDESAAPNERVLYQQPSGQETPHKGQAGRKALTPIPFIWTTTFDVGGRSWSLYAYPTPMFFIAYRTWVPWGVLSIGLLLTGLLVNVLFNTLRRSAQVERQVAKRTQDLTAEVTERQRAETALSISEARYRRLFETAKDGILILDGDTGLIEDVNPFLVEMLGYPPEEIVGKRLWEIGPFKDIARSKVAFDELQTREYVRYEDLPLQAKNGRPLAVEFVSNVYYVNKKRVIQCNIRDITARKRAEEALQLAHSELEQKVQDRTGELSNANTHLQESYEQVRRLALRLQTIREDERSGIARELHDELGQALTALKMDLVWASGKLPAEHGVVPERLTAMVALVDRMVETVQQVSSTLRPGILDDFGLLEAIRWQGREFQKRMGIPCRICIEPEHLELDPGQTTSLFRILQEALTNIARHANATEVTVTLSISDGQLILEITDNGRGITTAKIHDATSLGLTGMRERTLLLNGRISIAAANGHGTTVRVKMPYTGSTTQAVG